MLILLNETLRTGKKIQDITFKQNPNHLGRVELEKDGIIAIVNKQRDQGDSEQWLLTGFDNDTKQKESTDAIQTVIAKYSYTPEFSGFREQVRAVVSSTNSLSSNLSSKSSSDEERLVEFTGIIEKLLPVLQNKKGARLELNPKLADRVKGVYDFEKNILQIKDAKDLETKVSIFS